MFDTVLSREGFLFKCLIPGPKVSVKSSQSGKVPEGRDGKIDKIPQVCPPLPGRSLIGALILD